jgi:hypothetical protein
MNALLRVCSLLLRFFHWLRAMGRWLIEPSLMWFAIVVLIAAFGVAAIFKSEPGFRWTGLGLQFVGVGTVAWNIRGTRTQFSRPGILALVAQWFRRRPRLRSSTIVAVGTGTVVAMGLRARAEVWYPIPEDAALDARVDFIEKNQNLLR